MLQAVLSERQDGFFASHQIQADICRLFNKVNMNKLVVAVVSALFLFADTTAQTRLEGYVYEENNRGFLNQVNVTVI
jgi:hypothetical protein